MKLKLLWLMVIAIPAMAQVSNPSIISVTVPPSGACSSGLPNQQVISTGAQYSCQGGSWGEIGGGGTGSINGTVSSPHIPLATGADIIGDSPATYGTDGFQMNAPFYSTNFTQVLVTDPPFNAQCDGHTDDHVAIQAALNSGASVVNLPFSSQDNVSTWYQCNLGTTGVTIPSPSTSDVTPVTFEGNGSILAYAGTGTALTAGGHSVVRNLSVFLNGATGTPHGIDSEGADFLYNIDIENGPTDYLAINFPSGFTNGLLQQAYADGSIQVLDGGINMLQVTIDNSGQDFGTSPNHEGFIIGPTSQPVIMQNVSSSDAVTCEFCIQNTGGSVYLIGGGFFETNPSSTVIPLDVTDSVNILNADLMDFGGGTFLGAILSGTWVQGTVQYADHSGVSHVITRGGVQFPSITGHGTKGPICVDTTGVTYVGNNTGVGAACP